MFENIIKKGLHHADDIEVYYSKSTIRSVTGKKNDLKAESVVDQGMGIRVQVDGKVGFAYTTDLNDEECIKQAVSIARCKKDRANLEFPCSTVPAVKELYWKDTAGLSIEDIIDYVDDLLCIDDDSIKIEGSLEIRDMERVVSNSAGLDVSENATFADLSVAIKGECFVSEDRCNHSIKGLHGDSLVEDLVKRARNFPAGKVKGKVDTIILSPEGGSLLFSTLLCPAVCADNVLQKQSFLRGLEGKMVASEELTIRDDATVKGGLVSRSFDAEGIPSRSVPLIEKGRVAGFLHNLATAKVSGVESTGNAFRDYRNEPIVFPSNVIIDHEMKIPLKNLIKRTDRGLMSEGIIGAYSSDYITGDFSITLDECSLIEEGVMKRIENVSIGGNALNLLKSIECVSTETIQSGHFIIPYMKISDPEITLY